MTAVTTVYCIGYTSESYTLTNPLLHTIKY